MLELLKLPSGAKRLRLQPMLAPGEFELHDWRMEPVGWLRRVGYRWRRVIPVYFKLSRRQRLILGLRRYTPLINLKRAYYLAGNTRFYAPPLAYDQWFARFASIDRTDRQRIRARLQRWQTGRPRWRVILTAAAEESASAALAQTHQSLRAQLYPEIEIHQPGTKSLTAALAATPALRPETWVFFLEPGITLSEHALYWFAECIRSTPDARLIYCDQDTRGADGQPRDPVFKPDWSPELLRSTNYIGPAVGFHGQTLKQVLEQVLKQTPTTEGNTQSEIDLHSLLLRFCEAVRPDAIQHLAAPLVHLPSDWTPTPSGNGVQAHLDRIAIAARAERTARGHYRVRYTLPDNPPLVSVLIPTRDGLDYLRPCLESLLTLSTYPRFEVLVIDNGSEERATLDYLRALTARSESTRKPVRVLRDARPFNFAALNNAAAEVARGEVLCLLNNDTEVITPDWLETLVGHLLQPQVGVVGAKLYYSDGRIQHAGDTVGPGGCAHHLHAFLERDDPGYCDRAILAQDLSAVTAACLMTWRALYQSLGGLDAVHLPVAFNDVDYCLRVREQGQRVVWTPYAELYHHESVSRGKQEDPKKSERAARELAYMRQRWGHVMQHDPFYNLNLSYQRPDFSLSYMPMVERPWL
ncbi:glycosyltransferase [Lamprobacter modestohalophilus]|uniref:glycosyltransferase family 2 protein n=1 Tax=Lamprobacter modestohalophilus TaxID=1064514 RepID=UPI002ADEB2A5|nr:glycosyltransferase [Lamprobacter modestohalophilus]MEA1052136.1 glycosyltransferase [Lamprobacter modestohalophilus]